MIGEDDDKVIIPIEVDEEEEVTDYRHVTHHPYVTKMFCWIEAGETNKVISFFNTFPHLINSFCTANNWNPFMYAVRYGNMELIDYFRSKNMNVSVNSIFNHATMVHSAVYSGDLAILKLVLNDIGLSPNPPNSETPPLKIAMKINNAKMVETLISKGAYYVFGDVYNNVEPMNEENNKFQIFSTKKEISNNSIVEDTAVRGCQIKETLRWARVRQIMHLTKHARSKIARSEIQNSKFEALSHILANESHLMSLLKVCLGKGESILNQKESIEPQSKSMEARADVMRQR